MAFINLKQLWSCANELSRIANLVFVINLQFFQQQKSASLAIRVKDQQLCTKRPERDIFGLLARPPSRRISRCTIVVDDHLRRRRRRWSSSSSSSSPLPRDYETISAHYPSPSLSISHIHPFYLWTFLTVLLHLSLTFYPSGTYFNSLSEFSVTRFGAILPIRLHFNRHRQILTGPISFVKILNILWQIPYAIG